MIIVAYLVVGGILVAGETVANAQKDITLLNEAMMRTDISILPSSAKIIGSNVTLCLNNTGSEVIGDFTHMDVFTTNSAGMEQYVYSTSNKQGKWTIYSYDRDFVHPHMLDPGEAIWINTTYVGIDPDTVLVSTSNGVYTSAIIP